MEREGICEYCGSSYIKKKACQKYCKAECGYEHTKELRVKRYKEANRARSSLKTCAFCKKEFSTHYKSANFCSITCENGQRWQEISTHWASKKPRKSNKSFVES